ncbi:hypothetical protein JCM8097_004032 [Rhodosporidiobolus ruineniae]
MLDRLPPKVLLRILRLAAPLDIGEEWSRDTQSAHKSHRTVLMRICLVNKQLCGLAQPMLPEVFYVINDRQEQQGKKLGKHIKKLKILHREEVVSATLHVCPALEEARLGFGRPDSKAVDSLQNVNYLALHFVIPSSPTFPLFPHLVTLSFHHVKLAVPNSQSFFNVSRFPSLRNLGLGQIIDPGRFLYDEKAIVPGVDSALAARLRVLVAYDEELAGFQVSSAAFKGTLGAVFEVQGPFGGTITPPRQTPLEHMQFRIPWVEAGEIFPVLETYTAACSTLKTVQLPRRLRAKNVERAHRTAATALLDTLRSRNVKVLWSESFDPHESPLVSPELVAWAEKEHERKAVEEAEGALRRLDVGA